MRNVLCAVLAVPLMMAAAPRQRGVVGLGVGAASSTEVIVKINGKNETVRLAGIKNGTYAGQAFLQCLVAHRIVRVDRAANRVTMLDGSSVADHLAEFLLSKTPVDPCEIGKAAYVSTTPPLAASVAVAQPGEAAAAAPPAGKRRGTVSFGSSNSKMDPNAVKFTPSQPEERHTYAAPPQPAPTNQPTYYRPPTVGTQQIPQGSTTQLPNPGTTTIQSQGTVAPQQAQPYSPPSPGTTTIQSTTTSPP